MVVKVISNPLSGKEKSALLNLAKTCKQQTLLEPHERKLLFQAGKYPNWYTSTIPRFIDTFKSVWHLQITDELEDKININNILSKTNSSFLQKVKDINQIVSLADNYHNQGDKFSEIQAFEFYKAAETKSARAMFQIAEYYLHGYPKNYMELNYKETEKLIDYEKARIFYEKAIKKNNDDALISLGSMYTKGKGVGIDLKLALSYFEKYINNVETHDFILADSVKCLTDILWERLATEDNNLIEINIKTKKDIDDCKKCLNYIKKSITYLEEMLEDDYFKNWAEFYYDLAYMYALGSRFLPGGYKLYYDKASENFEKACDINSAEYEDLEITIVNSLYSLSYLFKDEFKIEKKVYSFDQSKDRVIQGNVITIDKFKKHKKEKFDDAWITNKLEQGESQTIEFKKRVFFLENKESNSRDNIINATSIKIARIVCGFLNADIYENAYIIFGVTDDDKVNVDGIKVDLTFFEKDFENKTNKDFKIMDRIIQNLREKLCLLIGKTEVANNVNIEKALYRKKVKLLIIEIKKSNKPIFIKHHTKIFSRASEYKQEPKRSKEIFKEEEYISGLFIRSSRDIDYLKGQELYDHFKINSRNSEIDENY